MATGTVKWFNQAKGYGFIAPEGGQKDVLFYVSALRAAGLDSLKDGQRVTFEIVKDANGKPHAEDVRPA